MLKRFVLLLGGPLVAVAVAVLAVAAAADDLPDPIATHWGVDGAPNGHTPAVAFFGGAAVLHVAAWLVLLVQARRREPAGLRLTAAPYAWSALAFLAGIVVVTAGANAGAASWRDAGGVGWAPLLAVLGASAAGALAAWLLERGRPFGTGASGGEGPDGAAALALTAGERAVWTRSLTSVPMAALAVVLGGGTIVGGLVLGGAEGWAIAAAGVVVAASTGTLSEIVATVDGRGLTIAYGPLGWPRQTVPLGDVASAERTEIDPWKVGGWGYRKAGSRRTAVVLRAGEGLRVVRRDGRELLVTVPDATTAAGLLTALRLRAG